MQAKVKSAIAVTTKPTVVAPGTYTGTYCGDCFTYQTRAPGVEIRVTLDGPGLRGTALATLVVDGNGNCELTIGDAAPMPFQR